MAEIFQLFLLVAAITLSLLRVGFAGNSGLSSWVQRIAGKSLLSVAAIAGMTFLGCLAVAGLLHEPVPRVQDEFSYLLMSETFTSGRVSNPSPPLPEFFDTFHVLIRPVYASKYFPAQGLFLALERS